MAPRYVFVNEKPRPSRPRTGADRWVSKTDFTDYMRCAFAFWLVAQGTITREQAINPSLRRLLEAGEEFEEGLAGDLSALHNLGADIVRDPKDEPALLQGGKLVLGTGLYRNTKLGIRGRPDGIDSRGGAMLPVEVKSHALPTPLDRLELAFYWLLLSPYRRPAEQSPRGLLVLRDRDGRPSPIEVQLREQDLQDVVRRLPMIRKARRYRPVAGLCSCYVCSVLYRDEVLSRAHATSDVSLLFGVGRERSDILRSAGVLSCGDLLACDPAGLLDLFRQAQKPVGRLQLAGWAAHAKAYAEGRLVLMGSPTLMPDDYVCLDLEYVTFGGDLVWAAGIQRRDRPIVQLWASGPEQERRLLTDLVRLLDDNPGPLVVTWSGTGADLPALQRAANRCHVNSPMAGREHLDLYRWCSRHLRLPTPGLSVKEVASFFEVPRVGIEIQDGLEATAMYRRSVAEAGTDEGQKLKRDLLNYNADDVVTLAGILETLRALMLQLAAAA